MANTSRLEFKRGYLLLLHVAIGLLILPSGLSQWCNTNDGEPLIKISSTPPSNKLPIGASINLTCSAWENDNQVMRRLKTRPHRIEWFDPQGNLIGDECKAKSPAAARMKCTLIVGALTEEKFGDYTCKASNGYNYCSNKRFSIILQDAQASESKEETEDETMPITEPNYVEESKNKSTEGKKPTLNYTEDTVCISKRKLQLECSKLHPEIKILRKDLEFRVKKELFDK